MVFVLFWYSQNDNKKSGSPLAQTATIFPTDLKHAIIDDDDQRKNESILAPKMLV